MFHDVCIVYVYLYLVNHLIDIFCNFIYLLAKKVTGYESGTSIWFLPLDPWPTLSPVHLSMLLHWPRLDDTLHGRTVAVPKPNLPTFFSYAFVYILQQDGCKVCLFHAYAMVTHIIVCGV